MKRTRRDNKQFDPLNVYLQSSLLSKIQENCKVSFEIWIIIEMKHFTEEKVNESQHFELICLFLCQFFWIDYNKNWL